MTSMIAEPPTSNTRLGVGFDANRSRARDTEAWKRSLGNNNRVTARLAMLPEGETRWDRIGVSAVVQLLILTFFVVLPIFFPERMSALKYEVTPLQWLVTEVTVAPTPPPPPQGRVKGPQPQPIEEPKLTPKQPHIFVSQR